MTLGKPAPRKLGAHLPKSPKNAHKTANPHFYMEVRKDTHKAVMITKPLDRANDMVGMGSPSGR